MTGSHNRTDEYAWSGSNVARIDPRVKIAATAALLAVNLAGGTPLVSAIIAAGMLTLMAAGRLPYRRQLMFIAFPVSFAVFVIASQTVFSGDTTFFSIGPWDFHSDGLVRGLIIALRIVAGGLVIVLLGATTPINRLCQALRWYRVPVTFVELLQLTYRYLHDIYAEFARMRQAQRARLGWSTPRAGLNSSRMLGGALFMRVFDRGTRSAEAMRCRGDGPLVQGEMPAPGRADIVAAIGAALSIVALVILSCSGVSP